MKRQRSILTLAVLLILVSFASMRQHHMVYSSPAREFDKVTIWQSPTAPSFQTTTISIPTYPYADHLIPTYTSDYNMHYSRLDWNTYNHSSPIPRDYELLILENDHLYVTLLPELGGRIYQMIFKPTGHNELYQNPVIKPTPWGPSEQGWWLAVGGIEWCLPVEEHGYEWGEPWSYQVVTSTAGVTVTLRDTSATDRIRAAVTVHLPSNQGYLAITPHIENLTGSDIHYRYWTNAMLAPGATNTVGSDLRLIFNTEEMSIHSTGDNRLPGDWPTEPTGPDYRFSWPSYNGTDFSKLGNWHEWLGFFEHPQAATDFVGVYDTAEDEGIVRIFPSDVARGSKGFGFGWSAPINSNEWTDDGSAYFELHGGVAPTFWDQATITAEQSLEWTEYWYPASGIGHLSAATAKAALGVRESGERFHVGVHSTLPRAAGTSRLYAWDQNDCTTLESWSLPDISPGEPFVATVAMRERTLDDMEFAYLDNEGKLLVAVNPRDCLPPASSIEPLSPWVETTTFSVTWNGQDGWTGVGGYDVQVRDGYEGTWTNWLTSTAAVSHVFTGVSSAFTSSHGHTYFFRVRARDVLGNQEPYGNEEWGETFTTVLTEPAPVLVTSHKSAASRHMAASQTVDYTILISNTGNLTASTTITDTLPVSMIVLPETLTASTGLPLIYPDNTIHWTGTITPGGKVRVMYTLSPTAVTPFGIPLTNAVEISGSVLGPFARHEIIIQTRLVWLPLVVRGWE
ncbi:MAG: DUF5107 domain-containing protein [Chloroflexi bacterium]|nr:DUF5107 domain-containing protein [Chloroflexota bacterium]